MGRWTHHHAPVNGIAMHWVEQGEGPAIVLCHGFPHLWISWHRQIGPLAGAGWRVIVPDMRGMGQTEAPGDPAEYDMHRTAGDLAALLDHLGVEQAVFAGLEYGIDAYLGMEDEKRVERAVNKPTVGDGRQLSHKWIAAKIEGLR